MTDDYSISYPDWGNPSGNYLFPEYGVSELGVRLGAVSTIYRGGKMVFYSHLDYKENLNEGGTGTIKVTPLAGYDREACLYFKMLDGEDAWVQAEIPTFETGKLGVEITVNGGYLAPTFTEFEIIIQKWGSVSGYWKCKFDGADIYISNAAGAYIATPINIGSCGGWISLKVIVDLDNIAWDSVYLGDQSYKTDQAAQVNIAASPDLLVTLYAKNNGAGFGTYIFLQNLAVTLDNY